MAVCAICSECNGKNLRYTKGIYYCIDCNKNVKERIVWLKTGMDRLLERDYPDKYKEYYNETMRLYDL